ncbi:RloB family protein [Massilia sp. CFBP9012]|uniref:RloB family protein n=1 Tax=Massilia sp. CFBP9012 TaxID=3096531 RepID=UPI002A6B7E74|nr:RloB family protein [Massilia sp. CFBP9012]MDY0978181.1 RloB family protein [Massilia sp. CFBP9012]
MGRGASSFRRREASFVQQPKVLVICEDTTSGKKYLNDAKVHFRANALIDVANVGHTDPRGIVEKAIERQAKYDNLYCVIDRDTHPTFDEAMRLAGNQPKIEMIVSYPCFEYWLYLHFKYSRRAYANAKGLSPGQNMLRELKRIKEMAFYEKGDNLDLFEKLLPRLKDAKDNAIRAEREAADVGEPNPSTKLHFLLDRFEQLGTPKAVGKGKT